MQSPFSNIPPVVKNLLIVNIIFFVAFLLIDHGSSLGPLSNYLAVYYFNSPRFYPWQIITYMFMHGGFLHIFFNMFVLFQFGPIVEYSIGSKKFFNFYFACGIGAVVLQMVVQAFEIHAITGGFTIPNPSTDPNFYYQYGYQAQKMYDIYLGGMVGASGAISGVMVAFAMLYPNMELMIMFIPVPIKAKYIIPGYLVVEVYLSVHQTTGDNVAHLAHLGGAIVGFLMVKALGMQKPNNNLY